MNRDSSPAPKKSSRPKDPSKDQNGRSLPGLIAEIVFSPFGRIPPRMLLLICCALIAALSAGLALHFARTDFMGHGRASLRISPSEAPSPFSLEALQGAWVHRTDRYSMGLTITKDQYEWIVLFADSGRVRYFSRGKAALHNDVLVLTKDAGMGYPYDRERLYVEYMPISMKDLNVRLSVTPDGQKLVWSIPAEEAVRLKGPASVLFSRQEATELDWTRRR